MKIELEKEAVNRKPIIEKTKSSIISNQEASDRRDRLRKR